MRKVSNLEPFKNDITVVVGEGAPKISDRKWRRGEGVHANSDITTKKILHKFLSFTSFWSPRQQLSFGQHYGGVVVSSIGLSSCAQAK